MFCRVTKGTPDADRLKNTGAIIWDEAGMTDRRVMDSVDRLFRDLKDEPDVPFGGVLLIMGGDWRQILPIVEGISGQDVEGDEHEWFEQFVGGEQETGRVRSGDVRVDVETDGGAGGSGSRESEDESGAVFEHDSESLFRGDRGVDGVRVLEVVGHGNLQKDGFVTHHLVIMSSPSNISVSLANLDVFMPFYPWMEMMCREQTPGQGKMIFPEMEFDIKGLDSEKEYQVSMSIERLDNNKYTYKEKSKQWEMTGKAAEEHEYKKLSKKKGESGATWMKEPLTFPEARITNKPGNEKEDTFYTASLQKYVPVVYIRDVETSEEHRFEVEKAQFVATMKIYNKDLGSWKAAKNPYSTRKNNGPGKSLKRKSEGHEDEAPRAKRTPLHEQQAQPSNWNTPNFLEHQPAASAFHPTYSSQYINPHFNYQAAPGFNHGYSSTSNINYGYYPSAPFNTTTNYHPGYYGQQHHQFNYNIQYHQYSSTPMTNLAPTFHDNSTPMTYSQPQTVSANTKLHDENSNFIQMYLGQDLH